METLKREGGQDIIVICGGVIPPQDYDSLYDQGISAIFGPGTPLIEAVGQVLYLLEKNR